MHVSFDLNALLGAGAALVVVVGGIAAGYAHFRKWIQSVVAQPAQQAADQLKTSNGTTVAGYVEASAKKIEQMQASIGTLAEQTAANTATATAAQTLARAAMERIDQHLLGHNRSLSDGGTT